MSKTDAGGQRQCARKAGALSSFLHIHATRTLHNIRQLSLLLISSRAHMHLMA